MSTLNLLRLISLFSTSLNSFIYINDQTSAVQNISHQIRSFVEKQNQEQNRRDADVSAILSFRKHLPSVRVLV